MTRQHREILESEYRREDPWGFQTHPDDAERKAIILKALAPERFDTALDYGCGEGWITKDLPAEKIYGWDVIPVALARCPENVRRWDGSNPATFQLVIATGILYEWYDGDEAVRLLKRVAGGLILTCHMEQHEIPSVATLGKQILERRFAYREMTEVLRIFQR